MIFTKIKQRNVKSVLTAIFMSGHTIQDEGVSLTQRRNLNFIGAGVTVTDDAANDQTDVTITSGGGSGDVVGPASAVNNEVALFDGTTGKLIKSSGVVYFTPSRRILYKNNVSSSLTGTTSETKMDSFLIPAGSIQANDILIVNVVTTKSGTAGTLTNRVRINTTGNGASGSLWATAASVAANLWYRFERNMIFKNSLSSQTVLSNTLSASTEYGGQNAAFTALTEDFSVDQHIVINFVNSNSGDTTTLQSWYVELIRT